MGVQLRHACMALLCMAAFGRALAQGKPSSWPPLRAACEQCRRLEHGMLAGARDWAGGWVGGMEAVPCFSAGDLAWP